jgi:hypothetical protein
VVLVVLPVATDPVSMASSVLKTGLMGLGSLPMVGTVSLVIPDLLLVGLPMPGVVGDKLVEL